MSSEGFRWLESTMYEHEVNLMQRFLVDTGCAGGSWVFCVAASHHSANDGFTMSSMYTFLCKRNEKCQSNSCCMVLLLCCGSIASLCFSGTVQTRIPSIKRRLKILSHRHLHTHASLNETPPQNLIPPPSTPTRPRSGTTHSTCALEVTVPWRCLHSLTRDATQLADTDWAPSPPPAVKAAMHARKAGGATLAQVRCDEGKQCCYLPLNNNSSLPASLEIETNNTKRSKIC